jgi:hypothetical protein
MITRHDIPTRMNVAEDIQEKERRRSFKDGNVKVVSIRAKSWREGLVKTSGLDCPTL